MKMVHSLLKVILTHGQKNDISFELYCYDDNPKMVMECSMTGVTRYYTVSVEGLADNSHVNYAIGIYQEGALTSYGELQDAAILAAATGLSMLDYGEENKIGSFGEFDAPYLTFSATDAQILILNLRLRATSNVGTFINQSVYMYFSFGTDAKVACSGDIRTLVNWINYDTFDNFTKLPHILLGLNFIKS